MFKKIRAFYKRNRVYSILMLISIICIISIFVGVVMFFVGQTNKNVYGTRLDGIDEVKITDQIKKEYIGTIKANEKVSNVEIDVRGRLIYIIITLKEGLHTEAEALAMAFYETVGEKEKGFYDIQFIVENEAETNEKFPIMGYVKAGNPIIKWTKYIVE